MYPTPQTMVEASDADDRYGDDARKAARFKAGDGWSEQKGKRESEGEGDDEIAGEIKDEDDDPEHKKWAYP